MVAQCYHTLIASNNNQQQQQQLWQRLQRHQRVGNGLLYWAVA